MAQFIATNILMLSFGWMLYLAARALPRVGEEEAPKGKFFERLLKSGIPERLDSTLHGFAVKFLRKSKVHLLKIENYVTARLHALSPDSGSPFAGKTNGEKSPIDFKEILDEKQGNESSK